MSYHVNVLITKIVVGLAATIIAVFAVAWTYVLVKALLGTSFNFSLTSSAGAITNNFFIYGFVSIEACFVGFVIWVGYMILKNATKRKVIEVEVQN